MTRVVFDCMVYLQAAARATGPAGACLQAVREGRLELVVSLEIVAEVRDVLTRPRVLKKFPALTVEAVELFLGDIESQAVILARVPRVFALDRDPKDEPYINLAIASGSVYLATWDKDLLDLMRDESARQQFPDLTILEPPSLLRTLGPA